MALCVALWLLEVSRLGVLDRSGIDDAQAFPTAGELPLPGRPRPVACPGHTSGHSTYLVGDGHVLSLEVLWTPYALPGGWRGSAEPQRWLDAFAGMVQPGFGDAVRRWRVVTPEDYEADFSMPRGYAPSFGGGPLAALVGRDRELTRYETPVAGLYLTGAGTFPGAGVWGASGRNAAQVVLRGTLRRTAALSGASRG